MKEMYLNTVSPSNFDALQLHNQDLQIWATIQERLRSQMYNDNDNILRLSSNSACCDLLYFIKFNCFIIINAYIVVSYIVFSVNFTRQSFTCNQTVILKYLLER